jgi:hypothetical protein
LLKAKCRVARCATADPDLVKVAEVAEHFGFAELGRFSREMSGDIC